MRKKLGKQDQHQNTPNQSISKCGFVVRHASITTQYKIWDLLFTLSYSLLFSLAHPFFGQLLPLLGAKGQSFSCCAIHCCNTTQHNTLAEAWPIRTGSTEDNGIKQNFFSPTHFKIAVAHTSICLRIAVLPLLNAVLELLSVSGSAMVRGRRQN